MAISEETKYTIQKNRALRETQERAKELIDNLIDLSNVLDDDTQKAIQEGIAQSLVENHRTLQQSTVCNLHEALKIYSKTDTDPRNQSAVEFAQKVSEIEHYFPTI